MASVYWLHPLVISVGIFVGEEKRTVRMKENKYLCVKKKMEGRRKQALTACIGELGIDFSLASWCILVSKGTLIPTNSNYLIAV